MRSTRWFPLLAATLMAVAVLVFAAPAAGQMDAAAFTIEAIDAPSEPVSGSDPVPVSITVARSCKNPAYILAEAQLVTSASAPDGSTVTSEPIVLPQQVCAVEQAQVADVVFSIMLGPDVAAGQPAAFELIVELPEQTLPDLPIHGGEVRGTLSLVPAGAPDAPDAAKGANVSDAGDAALDQDAPLPGSAVLLTGIAAVAAVRRSRVRS